LLLEMVRGVGAPAKQKRTCDLRRSAAHGLSLGSDYQPRGEGKMTSNELPGLEEMAAEMRGLEEMAALARARAQAPNADEPSQKDATATEHPNVESGPVEPAVASPTSDQAARENEPTVTNPAPSPLASLDSDTAIRLRWVLRDIRGKRTKLSPADPDDLRTLVEMALVEMRGNVPVLTNQGHWVLD
jgi:hypothetical protein